MNKRLKLYNDTIKFCVDSETKERLRRVSFKYGITPSEYLRYLIAIALKYEDIRRFSKDSSDVNYFIELNNFIGDYFYK